MLGTMVAVLGNRNMQGLDVLLVVPVLVLVVGQQMEPERVLGLVLEPVPGLVLVVVQMQAQLKEK